jgi:hypothetical protein
MAHKMKTIKTGTVTFKHAGEILIADYEINRETRNNESADYLDIINVRGKSNDWVDDHFGDDLTGDVDRAIVDADRGRVICFGCGRVHNANISHIVGNIDFPADRVYCSDFCCKSAHAAWRANLAVGVDY